MQIRKQLQHLGDHRIIHGAESQPLLKTVHLHQGLRKPPVSKTDGDGPKNNEDHKQFRKRTIDPPPRCPELKTAQHREHAPHHQQTSEFSQGRNQTILLHQQSQHQTYHGGRKRRPV